MVAAACAARPGHVVKTCWAAELVRAARFAAVGDEEELAEVRWIRLAEADELLPVMFEPVREYLSREIAEGE